MCSLKRFPHKFTSVSQVIEFLLWGLWKFELSKNVNSKSCSSKIAWKPKNSIIVHSNIPAKRQLLPTHFLLNPKPFYHFFLNILSYTVKYTIKWEIKGSMTALLECSEMSQKFLEVTIMFSKVLKGPEMSYNVLKFPEISWNILIHLQRF